MYDGALMVFLLWALQGPGCRPCLAFDRNLSAAMDFEPVGAADQAGVVEGVRCTAACSPAHTDLVIVVCDYHNQPLAHVGACLATYRCLSTKHRPGPDQVVDVEGCGAGNVDRTMLRAVQEEVLQALLRVTNVAASLAGLGNLPVACTNG